MTSNRQSSAQQATYLPQLGDRVQLRKMHPCGGDSWTVVRVGIDVELRCEQCERRIKLERPVLRKRIKRLLPTESMTE